MINEAVSNLLNSQINKEFYSSYLYLDFSNFFVEQGLNGFANWYNVQAQEEKDHALLFMTYMQNNNIKVTFESIARPERNYDSTISLLREGLKHEEYITASIHAIYDVAYTSKDFRTMQFLDWFIKEQGEEETNADDLIKKLELFGGDPKSLYLLDQELATRAYTAPSLVL